MNKLYSRKLWLTVGVIVMAICSALGGVTTWHVALDGSLAALFAYLGAQGLIDLANAIVPKAAQPFVDGLIKQEASTLGGGLLANPDADYVQALNAAPAASLTASVPVPAVTPPPAVITPIPDAAITTKVAFMKTDGSCVIDGVLFAPAGAQGGV